jgi:hypothetical protein
MSKTTASSREVLERLDTRHDELIARLDELNAQIELALAEFVKSRDARTYDTEIRKVA